MFPRKLKDFRMFNDGMAYQGHCRELTLPTIAHQMEDWRASGMLGPIKIDFGLQAIEFEWKLGGYDRTVLGQMGLLAHDGTLLRFIGGYQSDRNGAVTRLEAVARGRHEQIEFGNQKIGEDTEISVKTACSYYKLIEDDADLIEIDLYSGIYIVGGVDRRAELNAALDG